MKRTMTFGSTIAGARREFEVDITEFIGADGVLRQSGRDALRVALITRIKAEYPHAPLDAVESAAESCVPSEDMDMHQLRTSMYVKSSVHMLTRALHPLAHLPPQIMSFAQYIDSVLGVAGAHIYSLGQVTANVQMAIAILEEARERLEAVGQHVMLPEAEPKTDSSN